MIQNTLEQLETKPVHPTLRPPEDFCLPRGYRQQIANFTVDEARGDDPYWGAARLGENSKYQYYVYRWAASIIQRRGYLRVLDVGCGPGKKLSRWVVPVLQSNALLRGTSSTLIGVDQPSGVDAARVICPSGTYFSFDFENPPQRLDQTFDLIICADVIEHLVDPDPLMTLIRNCRAPDGLILFSTPDRDRERGRDCMASNKSEHVREWSREEFCQYLESRGLTIHARRRFPKRDEPIGRTRHLERAYQRFAASLSPLCCQAVLCS